MDIIYQYYNEIVLSFRDYDTDFQDGVIIIHVPDGSKSFDSVVEKINQQVHRIAETLDARDKEVIIRVQRSGQSREISLGADPISF